MMPRRHLVNRKSVPYGMVMMEGTVSAARPSRREERRASRREAILDVAQQSFLEHGYAASTMTAIAARLGGSKGTLWSYFSSKDVLFTAVLDRATDAFRQELSLILKPGEAVEPTLRRFCRGFIERVNSPDAMALYRLIVGEMRRFPEIGRIFFDRAPSAMRKLVSDYLAAAMAAGKLRQADPCIAAEHLTALCMSGSHQRLLWDLIDEPGPAQIRAEADIVVEVFLRAYG